MRMGAAREGEVEHARARVIGDVAAAPAEEPTILDTRDRRSDEPGRGGCGGRELGHGLARVLYIISGLLPFVRTMR